MGPLRRAAVAGSWYPSGRDRLRREVDEYLARADVSGVPSPPRALVAPHAGLMYSGPVAAHAYKAASAGPYAAIVLVGPSHFVPFRGVSIWPSGAWETPLGPVSVDAQLAASIASESTHFVDLPDAHGREHCLEMQLPFVMRLFPDVPIVPLVMGRQTRETSFAAGGAVARAVARRMETMPGDVLLVASSDLSHYEDSATAAELDAVVLDRVSALDPEGLMDALEREPRHACGGGPMVTVLHAARQLGARAGVVLNYADSGDVSGDKTSVVGYMAAGVW